MKKELPKRIGSEEFLQLNYANCRFMRSKKAYRTAYNPKNIFFTAKLEEGDGVKSKINMLHIHLRTPAEDRYVKEVEDLDIDLYIPESEFHKIIKLVSNSDTQEGTFTHEIK